MTTLATIDPEAVARDIERALIDHMHSLAMRLSPTIVLTGLDGAMGLRATARALAMYAQRGLPAWDWTDHGMAADGLLDVLAALYGRAADGDLSHTEIDTVDDVDPDDAVGLVLVAAAARVRLGRREALTARELGVLAGVTPVRIRQLMSTGELGATDERPARVKAREARRWLEGRAVAGVREQVVYVSEPGQPWVRVATVRHEDAHEHARRALDRLAEDGTRAAAFASGQRPPESVDDLAGRYWIVRDGVIVEASR